MFKSLVELRDVLVGVEFDVVEVCTKLVDFSSVFWAKAKKKEPYEVVEAVG